MLNSIKLKLNPYKDINIVSLDDKPLSPYSELNNYMKEPFLKWADKLLEAAGREINDDYRLIVSAEEFEIQFLKDMQNDNDSCISYEREDFQISYSVGERYNIISQLFMKYNLAINTSNFRMPVYSEIQTVTDDSLMVETEMENATLYIAKDQDNIKNMIGGINPKIVVVIANKNRVTCVSSMQYIWEIEEKHLSEVVNLIAERFVKVPLIIEMSKQLKSKLDLIDAKDQENLEMVTEIDIFVSVEDIKDIEVGKTVSLAFKTIPEGLMLPELRIISTNSNVIAVEKDKLTAVSIGRAAIEFYKAEEIIPFAKKEISTFKDNYVQKIELTLSEKKMGIGRKQRVNIALIPEDGDDANQVSWSVNDTNIGEIDESGTIISKKEGRLVITAETVKTKKTIELEVLPNLSIISLSESSIELYVGQTKLIRAILQPHNAFDSTCEWKTSDKSVAIVERLDDGTEIVRATGIGNCVVTCVAKEGGCSSSCNVSVESTFKKRENIHTMLSATAFCMVVALFCTAFSFRTGTVVAGIATAIFGVSAFLKNKSDRFWAVLLIVIAVIAVFW